MWLENIFNLILRECLGEAHSPCGCDQWFAWQGKVAEIRPEELKISSGETEDAANFLWLVTNSKPCPNCKSPIQKNEGCNHMKCSKCKFVFCWVCLESWKKHSSATGGYFRCNRYSAQGKVDEKLGDLITEASVRNQEMQELSKFIHYYTRFKNHQNSLKLEEPLLKLAKAKMETLANSLPNREKKKDSKEKGTKFIEEGIKELLKARRVLCGSYVYGYYLQDNGYNKTIFEYMQNELEEIVEKLSGMVARDYLVTPRGEIIATTYLVRKRRHKFVRAVSRGLLPPETPPALRKGRRKRIPTLMGMDPVDELESLEVMGRTLDPSQPWVKDNSGRHANLAALLDWPDFDSDDEESSLNQALTLTLLGKCSRKACPRPRARNPRTGTIHDFCSLRCTQLAKSYSSNNMNDICMSVWEGCDSNMELLIALEMSRLQMIEDEARRRQSWLQERSREHQREEQQFWSQTLPHRLYRSRNHMGASTCNLMGSVDDTRERYPRRIPRNAYASCERGSSGSTNANDIAGHNYQSHSSSIPQEPHCHSSQQLSSAEIAVDYFLKKLANNEISLRNLNIDSEPDHKVEKDLLCFPKKPPRTEDGRFEYGDFHENSYLLSFLPLSDMHDFRRDFRRSLSLGDLTDRSSDLEVRIDSDHAHQDYPEASSKLHLTNPLSNQRDSLDVESGSGEGELEWTDQGISSEVMGELDSPLTDLEVKGILSHLDASSQTETSFQLVVDEGTDKDESNSTEKSCGSQIAARASSLKIHISHPNQLETQSSNEFESETGIPNSPTLYISGVSISRSPEPRSPKSLNSKETRSPTLNVPHCRTPEPRCCSNRLQTSPLPLYTRSRSSSLIVPSSATTPAHFDPCLGAYSRSHVIANDSSVARCIHLSSLSLQATRASSPFLMNELSRVSRSASEPEKGRLVFQFPKSPTEGALSSVLHVEESTLSSDDFHEALFLSKSPKSSKRKKSKRERNRDKDGRDKSMKIEDKKDQLKVSKEWKEKHKESYKRKVLDNSTIV